MNDNESESSGVDAQTTPPTSQPEAAVTTQSDSTAEANETNPDAAVDVPAALPPTVPSDEKTTAIEAPSENQKPKKSHKKLWISLIVVLLVVAAGITAYALHPRKHPSQLTTSIKVTTTRPPAVPLTQTTFLDTAQKLPDLKFFADTGLLFGYDCPNGVVPDGNIKNCPPMIPGSAISYYKIGATAQNQAIIIAADENAGEGSFDYVAIEKSPNQYALLGALSGRFNPGDYLQQTITDFKKGLTSNVTLDLATDIPDLQFDQIATLANGTEVHLPTEFSGPHGYFIQDLTQIRGSYFNTPVAQSAMQNIGTDKGKTFYEVTVADKGTYKVQEIYGVKGTYYAANYLLSDPINEKDNVAIKWDSGNNTSGTYTDHPHGCGSAYGYVAAQNISPGDLNKVGTGPDGKPVYELGDGSSLLNEIYKTDYNKGADLSDKLLQNLSLRDFQDQHAAIIAQNALGEYVVYQRTDMFMGSGCGKPVVYLYPSRATDVSVKVGAAVVKSTPTYAAEGWQHVLAQPNGQLTYHGAKYPYLYWEGRGFGTYPIIDFGTVVPGNQVVTTIKQQLAEQGFRQNEINDFLAYWQPKLPTTPYVRLSWLSTQQMNQLAPLQISPQPTTVLRTFLDFQGLNAPEKLNPQQFSAPKRNGFTVVEWGGLQSLGQ